MEQINGLDRVETGKFIENKLKNQERCIVSRWGDGEYTILTHKQRKNIVGKTPEIAKQKPTSLQKLMQGGKNIGVDPSLLLKAGFEEFVKPGAKIAAKGAAGAADLAISAGKGGTGLAVGALLEADPIITGMSEGKTFGQTARDTFIGTAIDAIPGVNLGSLNEDLIKLADTEEQRVGSD